MKKQKEKKNYRETFPLNLLLKERNAKITQAKTASFRSAKFAGTFSWQPKIDMLHGKKNTCTKEF